MEGICLASIVLVSGCWASTQSYRCTYFHHLLSQVQRHMRSRRASCSTRLSRPQRDGRTRESCGPNAPRVYMRYFARLTKSFAIAFDKALYNVSPCAVAMVIIRRRNCNLWTKVSGLVTTHVSSSIKCCDDARTRVSWSEYTDGRTGLDLGATAAGFFVLTRSASTFTCGSRVNHPTHVHYAQISNAIGSGISVQRMSLVSP